MSDPLESIESHESALPLPLERRGFPRIPAAHLVYIDAAGSAKTSMGISAKTLDLSLSGIAVELSQPLQPETRFTVVLSFHDEVVAISALANRCVLVAEDLWEVGFQIDTPSRRFFQLLALSFADAMA